MTIACYVLHVKKGYEDREKSIIKQFSRLGLPFEWVLDHDIPEITPEVLKDWHYKGNFNIEAISCALKHITAWKRIAAGDQDGALVFEDDVLINIPRFMPVLERALAESEKYWNGQAYLSLGDGCALYVPWTKMKKGQYLYQARYARAADSYWLTRDIARKMVAFIEENGFALPADHLIDHICNTLDIPILWVEPTIAHQGSHTGLFPSSIQDLERGKWTDRLGWKIKIFRRKYIYPILGRDLTQKQ